ncbi:hypothetical protein [Streptomyces sp. NBC_00690]|uniref:hypothetical protein n=1 Tax=Streptomyces sp. NBC_00690 TaxID=2975808 RepID=UPI002E27C590|nr:hypothetical protein [Streptomyces sp. NBC_00690]
MDLQGIMPAENGIAGFEVAILVMLGSALGIFLTVLIARDWCTPQQWVLWAIGSFASICRVVALLGLT